jgi:hypothetical protein
MFRGVFVVVFVDMFRGVFVVQSSFPSSVLQCSFSFGLVLSILINLRFLIVYFGVFKLFKTLSKNNYLFIKVIPVL